MNALSENQVKILRQSYKVLDADVYATKFYDSLFAQHPQLRALFPADMEEQKAKLMSVFELVIYSFSEKSPGKFALQEDLIVPLRHLGIKHEEKGIVPAHYQIANQLMLDTLTAMFGKLESNEIYEAWALALQHLTAAMLNSNIKVGSEVKSQSGGTLRNSFTAIIRNLSKSAASL